MDPHDWLAGQFEANRDHLRKVAYRMLGSSAEADDAVQEAWLRLHRAGPGGIENLGGWLTTVVARVCLDRLRTHKSRREEPLENSEPAAGGGEVADPEQEALLADSVGLALLVVLQTLAPAERVAFVLHDMFDLPFDDIAPIVGRTPTAARQLASRARRQVRGRPTVPKADLNRQREVVGAYLAAARNGDLEALLAVLAPDVVLRADRAALSAGVAGEARGAAEVARRALAARARFARPALVDGAVGIVVAPRGRLRLVLRLTITNGKVAAIDVVADPDRLRRLVLGALPEV